MRIENGKAKFDQDVRDMSEARMRWMLCRILELADPPGPFTSDTAEAFVGGFLLACLNRIEGQERIDAAKESIRERKGMTDSDSNSRGPPEIEEKPKKYNSGDRWPFDMPVLTWRRLDQAQMTKTQLRLIEHLCRSVGLEGLWEMIAPIEPDSASGRPLAWCGHCRAKTIARRRTSGKRIGLWSCSVCGGASRPPPAATCF